MWTGAKAKKKGGIAYGSIYANGRTTGAHRVAYELATGEILEPGEPIHHKCGITLCVNPDHLQRVTSQENNAEMIERNWYKKRIEQLERRVRDLEAENSMLRTVGVSATA